MDREALQRDLASVLNRYSVENESNTPDFVLARFLMDCLDAFTGAVHGRDVWGCAPSVAPLPDNTEGG